MKWNSVAPVNCTDDEGEARCGRCGQFHLRPGYCQALARGYDPRTNPCLRHVTDARFLPADRGGTWREKAAKAVHAAPVNAPVNASVNTPGPGSVHKAVHKPSVNTPVNSDAAKAAAVRRAYRKAWMARKRKGEAREGGAE